MNEFSPNFQKRLFLYQNGCEKEQLNL